MESLLNKSTYFKSVTVCALSCFLLIPSLAQETGTATAEALQQKLEQMEAEIDYLKQEVKAQRKEAAEEELAATVQDTKIAAASKFSWSGDFRYRSEHITTATNSATPEQTRNRDRIRVRFGAGFKVNDTVTGKIQLATNGGADANAEGPANSTNQTLDNANTRKGVGIDLAYVDWKALNSVNVQLGKLPQPWTRTASYFWDGDISPEGLGIKYASGKLFGMLAYQWLDERHSQSATGDRADSKLKALQFGIKQPIGGATLTAAAGYFNVTNIAAIPSEYKGFNLLAQLDLKAGNFPITLFVDYLNNSAAVINTVAGKKLDTAMAYGVTFNRASAVQSWEVGVVYQDGDKDAVYSGYHDSDFGDGRTDTDGMVLKAAYVPATNWSVAGTYFINKLNNEAVAATANTRDLDYKRLQLDLAYKF
jgi:hypothetical protein